MDRSTFLPNSSIDILPNEILFDLSETIFDNAGSNYRDLLAFGLTCNDFFEPAMSVMWKDLDGFGFRPIVSCLPGDAIETRRQAKFPDPVTHVIGSLYVPGRRPDYCLVSSLLIKICCALKSEMLVIAATTAANSSGGLQASLLLWIFRAQVLW
jgi:hypothetical protein